MSSLLVEHPGFQPDFAIADLVSSAQKRLSPAMRERPWKHPELHHGTHPLSSSEALDCYLAAYGEMHSVKLEFAFQFFPKYELTSPFEVYDWGAGQGLASVEFLHFLKKSNRPMPSRLTLIEPSEAALGRARRNIEDFLSAETRIRTLAKMLPSERENPYPGEIDDSLFSDNYSIIVHLFSNVLDVPGINLKKMAEYIASVQAMHYIVCVGPCNVGEMRIRAFSRYFTLAEESLFIDYRDPLFAHTRSRHPYTCTILGFRLDCRSAKGVLCRYSYPPVQYHCGYRPDILANDEKIADLCGLVLPYAFEILAPFDIGSGVCPDPHPILAVLNNIVSRGLPTRTSPLLEDAFEKVFGVTRKNTSDDIIRYGIASEASLDKKIKALMAKISCNCARVQKTVLEAMLYGELPIKAEWHVLAVEHDVPCCALALADLGEMFDNLTSLSAEYGDLRFPKIRLDVVSSHFMNSPLHGSAHVVANEGDIDASTVFDIVLDVSIESFLDPDASYVSRYQTCGRCAFVIRSSASYYSFRQMITTERIRYQRLLHESDGQNNEPVEDTIRHLRYFLNLLFRKRDFRPGQIPILDRALRLESVIGLLPTGGGKSLTYQLASMLQPGVTLVIDPLVSLMKDQVDGLLTNGIDCCAYINSTLSRQEKEEVSTKLSDSQYLLCFLSPERLCIRDFRIYLRDMSEYGVYFAYGVIDEVHCVSEWGHDFRFSYLHLGRNLYSYALPKPRKGETEPHISLFGLTATASFDVLSDVERELSGNNAFPLSPEATVRYENTNRLELQYRVLKISGKMATRWEVFAKKAEILPLIVQRRLDESFNELLTPDSIDRIKKRFFERENITDTALMQAIEKTDFGVDISHDWYSDPRHSAATIVFCPHRSGSLGVKDNTHTGHTGIVSVLQKAVNCDVSSFIGGDSLDPQEEFIRNKTGIMVATKAFGMGIDKPNVRFTVHVNYSGSPEAFVQEAGRAGRDRKMALAVILYSDCREYPQSPTVDFGIHKFFHENSFLGKKIEKLILYYIMQYMEIATECDDAPGEHIRGLLTGMDSITDGEDGVYYISYSSQSQDYEQLNKYLEKYSEKKRIKQKYFPKKKIIIWLSPEPYIACAASG
ncbi:MAG: helicase-related protein [Desulfovibrionaceae bacterium]|nr:helicase-related protein [Desulfovibrionaceae bacterium]